ncbi:hypothetical protein [Marinobacterium sedimentorum]|uniref:hypothetical protein n=1 Tax=Marinobacterium sedimentorum TaxID=2927804 RepID=UPI0020C6491D|nr:hypothetical protein [Marinobacterium sedimentorum]MCP8689324.1 hypothetical protein [Marinobacterium sedimentorum]
MAPAAAAGAPCLKVSGFWCSSAPIYALGDHLLAFSCKDVCASSLSDLSLIYCGKAEFGHFSYSLLLNRTTIRRKRAQKLPQIDLSLATIGQARQAAGSLN